MKKYSVKRRKGVSKYAQARWNGLQKILKLVARAKHSIEVEPVIDGHYATDLLAHSKGI